MSSKHHSPVFAPFFEVRGNLGFGGTIPVPKSSMFYRPSGASDASVISVPTVSNMLILTTEANKLFDYTGGAIASAPTIVLTSENTVTDEYIDFWINSATKTLIFESPNAGTNTSSVGMSFNCGNANGTGNGGDISFNPGIGGATGQGGDFNIILPAGSGGTFDGIMTIQEGGGGTNAVLIDVLTSLKMDTVGKAAANNLVIASKNATKITGNTEIHTITSTAPYQAGAHITLVFTGTPTVKHNTAGTGDKLKLAGSVDLVAAADTVLGLMFDGSFWQETFRKVA